MQKYFYSTETKARLSKAFGDSRTKDGAVNPRFPNSAEREYVKAVNEYMRSVKKVVEAELPKLSKEYARQLEEMNYHSDGIFDFASFITDFFGNIKVRLNTMESFGRFVKRLRKAGRITKKHEIAEWRRMVKKTLGVDLSEDYYNGEFFEQELEQWVKDNVELIRTVPQDMLGDMKDIVSEAYTRGISTKEIQKAIQERYGMSANHARLIARDQMSKLNGQITRKQHEDAGVTRYRWSTSKDSRVRAGHALLEGQIFEYANPPEIMEWRERKSGGYWVSTGRHCNPTEDYQCRCCAIPVFDEDEISLPIQDNEK